MTTQEREHLRRLHLLRCPYCHEGLAGVKASDLQTCVGCRAVLHRACLKEYGSCTTRGCRNNRRETRRQRA